MTITIGLNTGATATAIFDITVCGNEVLTPVAGAYSMVYFPAAPQSISVATYQSFIAVSHGATTNAACTINNWVFYSDVAATTVWTHPKIFLDT